MNELYRSLDQLMTEFDAAAAQTQRLVDMCQLVAANPGLRVAYFTKQSATEPEQAGLRYGDKGNVLGRNGARLIQVRWDKGFIHSVSVCNLRLLELLESLCDAPTD